jgi:hypothetical protein
LFPGLDFPESRRNIIGIQVAVTIPLPLELDAEPASPTASAFRPTELDASGQQTPFSSTDEHEAEPCH